jgi:hypothetical protein
MDFVVEVQRVFCEVEFKFIKIIIIIWHDTVVLLVFIDVSEARLVTIYQTTRRHILENSNLRVVILLCLFVSMET